MLSQGAYTGGAAGFQLQSLLSIRDLRANGGKLSLLHFIVTVMPYFATYATYNVLNGRQ